MGFRSRAGALHPVVPLVTLAGQRLGQDNSMLACGQNIGVNAMTSVMPDTSWAAPGGVV